jgi:hypothetical protein
VLAASILFKAINMKSLSYLCLPFIALIAHADSDAPEAGAASLHLSAQTGLQGLTQREASVYYLRLAEQIDQGRAALVGLTKNKLPYTVFLDSINIKASKYTLSPSNAKDAMKAEAHLEDLNKKSAEITAQIEARERRQARLIETYPIHASIITLRNKFRLAPEQTSGSYLEINIETKNHGNTR